MMKLYHGTTVTKGDQILKSGIIDGFAKGNYDDSDPDYTTTKGFVYLTPDPVYAYYYAQFQSIFFEESRDYAMIFEVEVDNSKLEPDFDELMMVARYSKEEVLKATVSESLEMANSIRVAGILLLESDVKRYSTFPLQTNRTFSKADRDILMRFASQRETKKLTQEDRNHFNRLVIFNHLCEKKPTIKV
ncbi:hypothetical protein [Enterococcus faecalis]|uniref:hypothetical protein n=2 Tax=Enterococcus TaxID=1350 RepID=UPI0011439F4B|nr:hypothetical protein [Enterococcus faecalis]EKZ0055142.1 hypothetical protein [Enterococcus faecalis]EKZ0493132.1 hypothetical protein [Enterococcus faecalis]MBP4077419.1 hypothetical protein [Enterococcus faecalis]MBP4095595.1 hypothetical protein [Enterococcus faecalis]MBP4100853.1 hypothetical protein [Enterococcus faecalis]